MAASDPRPISRNREVEVYSCKYLKLYDDEVIFREHTRGTYVRLTWNCPHSVGVVPVTANNQVLLIRQFCYAAQNWIIQIPKGFGDARLTAQQSAEKELREELGAIADSLELLADLKVDPGLIENPFLVFLARNSIVTSVRNTEAEEVIAEPVLRSLEDISWISELQDSTTIAGICLAHQKMFGVTRQKVRKKVPPAY